jgi:deoxyadenosine/deoxycytidine kinase
MSTRIVIDGNIGSGKSTQVKLLAQEGYKVLTEQIDDWPLDDYYKDPPKFALALQLAVLKSFQAPGVQVYERSPESSREVFWKMLRDEGTVTEEDDDTYQKAYDKTGWYPDVHIYIDTPPQVCFDRLESRRQVGDNAITLDYIKKIDRYYKKYIMVGCAHKIDGRLSQTQILEQILWVIRKKDELYRADSEGSEMSQDI